MFMVLIQRFMALNFLQILQPSHTYSSTRFILSKIFVIICLIISGSSSRNLNSMDSMIRLSFLQERFPGSYYTIFMIDIKSCKVTSEKHRSLHIVRCTRGTTSKTFHLPLLSLTRRQQLHCCVTFLIKKPPQDSSP